MDPVIQIQNLSKMYRLGVISTGTISHDLNRWWYKVRGKEDPYLKIGESNKSNQKSTSGYVWALKDVNLEVGQGEIMGIIGKNGSGKSTLLKILSKVTGPTTGTIKYKGRIGSLLEVGTGFHPELTGRENIFLNGAILGMTKAEIRRKLDEIVDFAGVERYADTPVKRYSSGMKVRLGFAVAAFLEPEILVVDEVLAVGDAEFQKKAIGKMKEVSKGGGRTVLFVSHNMASISNLCSKTILLNQGKIHNIGVTEEIIQDYLNFNKIDESALVERKDREGTAEVIIEEMLFLNKKNKQPISSIISGQSVVIQFSMKKNVIHPVLKSAISIAFYNKNGEHFFNCSSSVLDVFYDFTETNSKVQLVIDKWPTSGGLYTYDLLLGNSVSVLDFIKNAGSVMVESGDYYGHGKISTVRNQAIFIDYYYRKND